MDIRTLSALLGHAQPSTTLKLYCHSLPDHKKERIDKLQPLFSKKGHSFGDTVRMPDLRASKTEPVVSKLVSG